MCFTPKTYIVLTFSRQIKRSTGLSNNLKLYKKLVPSTTWEVIKFFKNYLLANNRIFSLVYLSEEVFQVIIVNKEPDC